MREKNDAVVIGTGFGGAVAACRLAQAGLDVAILERGRRYDQTNAPFPRDFGNVGNGWLWQQGQGLFDVKPIRDVLVVESAGYGGGSLIYANVHLRAPADVFSKQWPKGYCRESLDPYYDLVAYMLDIRPIADAPAGLPSKTRRVTAALERLGRSAQTYYPNLAVDFGAPNAVHRNKFDVAQAGCNYCGECDIGCNVRAKNTLDMNYLAVAEQKGAVVGTLCEATGIAPADGGYVVRYRNHALGGVEEHVFAKAVFVCGGAINTTELLLRCRDDSKTLPNLRSTLGQGYSGNGDFLAFAFDTSEPGEPTRGPTITTAVVYDVGEGDGRTWFTLQDGGYPKEVGSLFQFLREGSDWLPAAGNVVRAELEQAFGNAVAGNAPHEVAEAATTAVFLAMGRDRANGTIDLDPCSRAVCIRWDLSGNLPLYGAEERLIRDVVGVLGGEAAMTPPWALLHQPVSVHNLGGCCMGDDDSGAVTDGGGEVFGYPNLFVLDGACLPSATGVNPSHTIAAVAERNIERFVRRWRKEPNWAPPQRADAKRVNDPLPKIAPGSTPPTLTRALGIAFTETMKGFFVAATAVPEDAAAYVAAERAGARADMPVQFTLTIAAADLDRFLSDRAHAALAVGDVQARGLTPAEGASVTHGIFNLFVVTDSFYERKMLYALPFIGLDGNAYLLDGYKEVKDHGHFDVWGATSTLYTVIRRGATHNSPVCAAGILRILIPDFMHQLTTFDVPGARGTVERIEALSRFGGMFMGSLWDVFAKPLMR